MRRLFVLLSALLALTVIVPSAAFAQDATPEPETASARTDVRYLLPFGPDGLNPALTVTVEEGGSCTPDSIATPDRPDAWDCIGESNQIYDPCFENPFVPFDEPGEVACIDTPFSDEVVLLTLNEPLAREKEAPAGPVDFDPWDFPWALELANGDRCTLLHGTEIVLAGEAVHYGCEDGGSILGDVERGQPVWTVSYLADGAVSSGLVDVAVAWS
ncbi:MAG: hypothetical protein ACRDJC_08275 [Thermomicrobiales bacterium]